MKVKSIRKLKDGLRFVTVEQTIYPYKGIFRGYIKEKCQSDFIEVSEGVFRDVTDGEYIVGELEIKLDAAIWKYEYDKGQ